MLVSDTSFPTMCTKQVIQLTIQPVYSLISPHWARPGKQKNTTQLAVGTIKHNAARNDTGAGEETMAGFLPSNLCL